MIRRIRRSAALLATVLAVAPLAPAFAQTVFPGTRWEAIEPARSGWSAAGLRRARAQFDEMGSTALVVVHRGRIVAAWGDVSRAANVYSVRKSFMSALYGIALARGQIDLGATLAELGIDDKPPSLTAREKQATVRDLLMARSGVYHEAAFETRTMKRTRPERGSHAPGTFWFYNNWDFNALGTILHRATGEDTFDAIERNIARPIGMETFTAKSGRYVYAKASEHPAYTLTMTAPDLARFGWLYLNRGRWRDRQVVPSEWVAESTRIWSPDARRGVGYGYLWWVPMRDRHFRTDMGRGSFSARGNGGQFIVIAPERQIVIAHLNDREENDRLESGAFNELMQLVLDAAPQ